MSAKAERRLPYAVALIASIVAVVLVLICETETLTKPLAAGTMTFGIVVAGFAATQRNMLLGMRGSRVLQFAARTGLYADVLDYLMHNVYVGVLVSVVSVIGFFLGDDDLSWSIWLVVIAGLISLVLALTVRNEIMVARIIRRFLEEQRLRSDQPR